MLAKNDESAVQLGPVADAIWDIEPNSTAEYTSQYKIITACFTMTVLNVVTTWFEKEPGNTCWKTHPVSQTNPYTYLCFTSYFINKEGYSYARVGNFKSVFALFFPSESTTYVKYVFSRLQS